MRGEERRRERRVEVVRGVPARLKAWDGFRSGVENVFNFLGQLLKVRSRKRGCKSRLNIEYLNIEQSREGGRGNKRRQLLYISRDD